MLNMKYMKLSDIEKENYKYVKEKHTTKKLHEDTVSKLKCYLQYKTDIMIIYCHRMDKDKYSFYIKYSYKELNENQKESIKKFVDTSNELKYINSDIADVTVKHYDHTKYIHYDSDHIIFDIKDYNMLLTLLKMKGY